jgi:hypothetical protein
MIWPFWFSLRPSITYGTLIEIKMDFHIVFNRHGTGFVLKTYSTVRYDRNDCVSFNWLEYVVIITASSMAYRNIIGSGAT